MGCCGSAPVLECPSSLRVMLVGDDGAGKTTLAMALRFGCYKANVIRCEESFDKKVPVATSETTSSECRLTVLDTYGGVDYDRIRPLSYRGVEVFLVCFSVMEGYKSVLSKWFPELENLHVPRILVGTKIDLRSKAADSKADAKTDSKADSKADNNNSNSNKPRSESTSTNTKPRSDSKSVKAGDGPVTFEQGTALAKKLRAFAYVECSAKEGRDINLVFEHAVRAKIKKPGCCS